jgi:transcriptional regulator with XRE-family HTH domain
MIHFALTGIEVARIVVCMSGVAQKVAAANQAETARELGLSRAYLSRMLRGERRVTLKVGVKLSKRLGVSAEALSEYLEMITAEAVN